jgi:hypothetical protein
MDTDLTAFRGLMPSRPLWTRRTALAAMLGLAPAVALLRDPASMPRWIYATKSAQHLSGGGGATGVSRVVNELPGPLSDRESIVQWAWAMDATGRVVTLSGRPAESPPEPLPDTVRMPGFASSWTLRALGGADEDGIEVEFEGWANPGGNLALPFLRGVVADSVWRAPLNTLRGMQRMLPQEPYRSAAPPDFLRVP